MFFIKKVFHHQLAWFVFILSLLLFFAGCATPPVYVSHPYLSQRGKYASMNASKSEQANRIIKKPGATSISEGSSEKSSGGTYEQLTPQHLASLRLVDLGEKNINSGNYDQAISILEQAIGIDSYNAYAYYYLSLAWLKKNQPSKALEFAHKAELLSQKMVSKLKMVYMLEGDIYEKMGDLSMASTYYQKAQKVE